ncbi:hypothetical protein ACFPPD_14370 [Cohnella suwonensis]|uniref:Lipoprotein n=1 Tax=Cohnella suwonensis TaxID=696072 RepID=A0ABW0LXB9_9BACL
MNKHRRWRIPLLIAAIGSLLAALLGGCGSGTAKNANGRDFPLSDNRDGVKVQSPDGDVTVKANEEGGTVEVNGKDDNGETFKYEAGSSELPDGFPKELIPPGKSTVTSTLKTTTDGGFGYFVGFDSDASVKETADHYRKSLKDKGFDVSEFSSEGNVSLIGGNDKTSYLVGIGPRADGGDGCTVTVTFGDNG